MIIILQILENIWNLIIQFENIFGAIVSIAIALLLGKYISVIIRRRLHEKVPPSTIQNVAKIVYYIILLIGIAVAIRILNIPGVTLSELLVAGGFAGIVIGLAAQPTLSNFIAGILLMTERPFKIGDFINYSGNVGMVVDVGLLSTKIQSWEGYYVRIPNNELFNSPLINYSNSKARLVRVQFTIPFEHDLKKVIQEVQNKLNEQWYVLADPGPVVFPIQFNDNGILIEARAWTSGNTWFTLYSQMPSLIEEVLKNLGVPYSYPRRILTEDRDIINK